MLGVLQVLKLGYMFCCIFMIKKNDGGRISIIIFLVMLMMMRMAMVQVMMKMLL